MNISILVSSLKYLDTSFNLVTSLASWFNTELIQIKYTDDKLITSFSRNDLDVAETIIKCNEDKAVLNKILILQNDSDNSISRLKLLIEHGADVHINSDILLRYACLHNQIDVVKLLLRYNINITVCDYISSLYNAYISRSYDIVGLLLIHNIYNKRTLYYAIYYKAPVEVVRSILEVTSLVDYKIDSGFMCYNRDDLFRYACNVSDIEVIKVLVEHGADIHNFDDCCFKLAVNKGDIVLVKYFLSLNISRYTISKALDDLKHYTNDNTEMIELLKQKLN